jgi:3-oxoacyl-[acyl-carrier protein] reductase
MQNRVAIITGGGRGLGRAFAHKMASQGAIAVIADINPDNAHNVAAEITSSGGQALAIPTDVSDTNSVDAMTAQIMETYNRIDVLVNSAAVLETLTRGPFENLTAEEFNLALNINVTGSFLTSRAVVHPMRNRGWGRIIHLSSDTALTGNPWYLHYVTSKAALVGMTRSMARELGKDGITVNAIQPGLTETEVDRGPERKAAAVDVIAHQAIPRQEVAEDLIGTLMFLASDDSAFVTGQTIAVNGGFAFR